MNILITGSNGFIGKNLTVELRNRKAGKLFEFDRGSSPSELQLFTKECDLVYHLAGINRPQNTKEFEEGNFDFTNTLISYLKQYGNRAPIIFSSSVQAKLDNPYGRSKLAAENLLIKYSEEMGIPVSVYRFPNVFGKWSRPFYNSVISTFCHNIANGLPIQINDPGTLLNQVYIDDVLDEIISKAESIVNRNSPELIEDINPVYPVTLGNLASLLMSFRENRTSLRVPDLADPFIMKLYATYLSYLPENEFSYPLKMNIDNRGSFTEFIRTNDRGQVSINISKPGIVKGNHWHHTKNEKFLVVYGMGVIRFRKIGTSDVIKYHVNGEKLEVVDIPTGYIHNIKNLGTTDMITVMWASEVFDPKKPDTFFEEV